MPNRVASAVVVPPGSPGRVFLRNLKHRGAGADARPRNGCACLLLSLPHFLFRLRSLSEGSLQQSVADAMAVVVAKGSAAGIMKPATSEARRLQIRPRVYYCPRLARGWATGAPYGVSYSFFKAGPPFATWSVPWAWRPLWMLPWST